MYPREPRLPRWEEVWPERETAPVGQQRLSWLGNTREFRTDVERHAARTAELLNVIAHDARQPLTTIRGQAQLASHALASQKLESVQASLQAIDVASRRLDVLLRDLIESVDVEIGHVSLEIEEVEVAPFLHDLIRRLTGVVEIERVRVESPQVVVAADPDRLERIIGNLLSNALKYSDRDAPVDVRVEDRGEEVRFVIVDRGRGIAPEDLPHIFDKGYRAPTIHHRVDGLGLGLSIVRGLVDAHGGAVRVETEVGRGSTFTVTLPRHGPPHGHTGDPHRASR